MQANKTLQFCLSICFTVLRVSTKYLSQQQILCLFSVVLNAKKLLSTFVYSSYGGRLVGACIIHQFIPFPCVVFLIKLFLLIFNVYNTVVQHFQHFNLHRKTNCTRGDGRIKQLEQRQTDFTLTLVTHSSRE